MQQRPVSDPHCDANSHPHTDSNSHTHTDPNADPNAHSHRYSHRWAAADENAGGEAHLPVPLSFAERAG
jgi:hypothetical protein